tara:strand:+ start:736 stop:1932 length:1197 start_codon:yes stop_codon:yes gene_type:complete
MIISMVLGFIFALLYPSGAIKFIPMGEIFIRLLKMIIVPLVFTSIVLGISRVANNSGFSRLGIKTLSYYLFSSLFAIIIGLGLINMVNPGKNANILPDKAYDSSHLQTNSEWYEILIRMIPDNPIYAAASGDMLAIIFFALIFGFSISRVNTDSSKSIFRVIEGIYDVIIYITGSIIKLAPLGVFGLVIKAVSKSGFELFHSIGLYMLTIMGGLLIHLLIVLPIIFYLFTRISPLVHFRSISNAMLMAFSTSSSSATLPVTLDCLKNNVKVPKSVSSFVAPLGSTVNMDGTALYECAGALFIAQVLGIDLTLGQQITVVFTALLASIGAAGIPSAGLVMIYIVLESVGLGSYSGVDLIVGTMLAVDRPLDMLRTMVNVTSDTVGTAIIANSENHELYN